MNSRQTQAVARSCNMKSEGVLVTHNGQEYGVHSVQSSGGSPYLLTWEGAVLEASKATLPRKTVRYLYKTE